MAETPCCRPQANMDLGWAWCGLLWSKRNGKFRYFVIVVGFLTGTKKINSNDLDNIIT